MSRAIKINRNCPLCSHTWLGRITSAICPKCKKYIGAVAVTDNSSEEKRESIDVTEIRTELPSIPENLNIENKESFKKSVEEESIKPDIPEDTYTGIVAFPFDLYSDYSKKEHWRLTTREKKTLEPLLKKVGDKWIGKWFSKYPEEGALLIAFALIIAGKVTAEISYRNKPKTEVK